MKKFFQFIVFIIVALVAVLVFANLRARWEMDERREAINRALDERIARINAENARRNQIAAQLQREALSSEADAQARWNAAKDRGKLPGNNTEAGFTPATGNAFHQTGTRY
jgi:uncharacterized protein YlxW (UPF0749 family)